MEENDAVLCGHYAKMLGLTGDWKVSGVDLSVSEKRLELEVKWEQSGAVCPECGQECSRYDVAEERRWRHLDAMGFETLIRARVVPRHAFPWERDGCNGALIRGDWQVGHGEICQ